LSDERVAMNREQGCLSDITRRLDVIPRVPGSAEQGQQIRDLNISEWVFQNVS